MKRFSKRFQYYHLFIDFFVSIIFVAYTGFSAFSSMVEEGETISPLAFAIAGGLGLILWALLSVYWIFYIKKSGYALNANQMECKRGVFFKKRSVLEYQKMHTINKRQNVFQKLFKIAVLTVDSGSANTAHAAEIVVIERQEVVDKLIAEIKARQAGEYLPTEENVMQDEAQLIYKFERKNKVVYSAVNAVATLLVCGLCAVLLTCIGMVIYQLISLIPYGLLKFVMIILVGGCGLSLAIFLQVFLFGLLGMFLAYYNFTVKKTKDSLIISYGLFVTNTNTFELKKIKGIKISQNIIKRLFGYLSVGLEVIGYANAENNQNGANQKSVSAGILMPLVKANMLLDYLEKALPEYLPEEREVSSKYVAPFMLWQMFFVGLGFAIPFAISLIAMLVCGVNGVIILGTFACLAIIVAGIYLVLLWNAVLQKDNTGINVNPNKITAYHGGFIKKCGVITPKNVVAVEDVTTPMRAKKKVYTFIIHFRSNAGTNKVKVKNVDEQIREDILALLKF